MTMLCCDQQPFFPQNEEKFPFNIFFTVKDFVDALGNL